MDISLKEMQVIELEILQKIHDLCQIHEITYYMSGGTLLGAVRHQGFIPWDDDIDIYMPRQDYNRFCEIALTELPDYLALQNQVLTENYPYFFAKVIHKRTRLVEPIWPYTEMGVYVDIFPIDGLPANPLKRFWLENKVRFLHRLKIMHMCANQGLLHSNSFIKHQLKRLLLLLTPDFSFDKLDKKMLRYDFYSAALVKNLSTNGKSREKVPMAYMGTPRLMAFEGRQFYGMAQAERYLTHFYGDYLQLPPKAERVSHHQHTTSYLDGWELHTLFDD